MLNKKLTPIVAKRTVKHVAQKNGELDITFADGSLMKIKTGDAFSGSIEGKEIKAVRQKAKQLDLDFADGTSAEIALAEETSSVMLRDSNGTLEYAD